MAAEAETEIDQRVRAAVRDELSGAVEELRRFLDRRISELSTELHATVQLLDFSETNISGHLTRIHDQIGKVLAMPAASARNSGIELEAVVEATEDAANRIMAAAEAIGERLRTVADPGASQAMAEQVNAIFEACTFQDLTSQRIRRTIEHLRQVGSMLGSLPGVTESGAAPAPDPPPNGPDLGQSEVDRLFA